MPWPIPTVVDAALVARDTFIFFLFGLPFVVALLGVVAAVDALIPGTGHDAP